MADYLLYRRPFGRRWKIYFLFIRSSFDGHADRRCRWMPGDVIALILMPQGAYARAEFTPLFSASRPVDMRISHAGGEDEAEAVDYYHHF